MASADTMFGGRKTGWHAIRFNIVGKHIKYKEAAYRFATHKVWAYEATKQTKIRRAIAVAKRMATKSLIAA